MVQQGQKLGLGVWQELQLELGLELEPESELELELELGPGPGLEPEPGPEQEFVLEQPCQLQAPHEWPLQLWLLQPSLAVLCPSGRARWQGSEVPSQGLSSQVPLWLLSCQGGCCQGMGAGPGQGQLSLNQEARRMLVGVSQASAGRTWRGARVGRELMILLWG